MHLQSMLYKFFSTVNGAIVNVTKLILSFYSFDLKINKFAKLRIILGYWEMAVIINCICICTPQGAKAYYRCLSSSRYDFHPKKKRYTLSV